MRWRGTGSLELEGFGVRDRAQDQHVCREAVLGPGANVEYEGAERGAHPDVPAAMRLHSRGEPCISHDAPSACLVSTHCFVVFEPCNNYVLRGDVRLRELMKPG